MSTVKTRRGWNGKLSNLDGILSWMYSTDILTQTDKNAKDHIINKYYRYYNDGDKPRGFAREREQVIETYLENLLTDFIRHMIRKYAKKVNRQDYYRFKADERFKSTNASQARKHYRQGLLNVYYSQKYAEERNLEEAQKKIENLKEILKQAQALEVEIARLIKKDFRDSKRGAQILKDLSTYDFEYEYGYVDC